MSTVQFIDTHTHLDDDQFDADRDAVILAAENAGVGQFINIAYAPGRWASTIALAEQNPRISYAMGLHPGNADEWSPRTFDALKSLVSIHRPVAIGEIGIDLYWRQDNLAVQHVSFRAQIDLALESDLPIVIHQRMAGDEVETVLNEASAELRVLLHSFDGHPGLTQLALERGWTIGVGGLATRRQNEALRTTLTTFPLNQIVLETDSPYLVPSGVKSNRNTPSSIPVIAERLATLRGQSLEEIADATTANATLFFRLPVPVETS